MKTIDLDKNPMDLVALIKLASKEPLLLVTPEGKEFCLAEADDFDREIEALRESKAFQDFLDERAGCAKTIALEEIEAELARESSE